MGAGVGYRGVNGAATIVSGSYPRYTWGRLASPPLTLSNVSGQEHLELRFWHSYQYANGSGKVEVSVWTNGAWGGWTTMGTPAPSGLSGSVWTPVHYDLTAYAGQTVRIGFYHSSDYYVGKGWLVDEVEIWKGVPQFNNPEDFEIGWGDWYAENGVWQIGVPTSGPGSAHSGTNCAGTVLGGNYPQYTSSRLISAGFALPQADGMEQVQLRFWQWYNYANGAGYVDLSVWTNGAWGAWKQVGSPVQSGVYSGGWMPVQVDLTVYAGQTVRLGFRHTSDYYTSTGWYIDEVRIKSGPDIFNNPESFELGWGDWNTDNYTLWRIGVPASGPPPNTNNFNRRAYSGTNVAACVLSGSYPAGVNSRLVSPSFTVPNIGSDPVVLRFWQWYQYGTGDAGLVQIAPVANPTNWTTLAVTATNGTSTNWSAAIADLSLYQGQQVRIGFYHTANSDGSVGPGWYLDKIEVASQSSPFVTTQPQSQAVLVGSNATFSVIVAGASPLGCQWQFNNTNLTDNIRVSGSLSTNLTLANVATNDAGNYRVVVTNTYGSATSEVAVLTVVKITPVLTWANPASITYGTVLSSGQLYATASVPGTFIYSPAAGAVLNVGVNTLSVVFTPTDTARFNNATGTVTLSVSQAPLNVTANDVTRAFGQPNPPFTGRITGLQNGDFITANYGCSATSWSFPGTYPIAPSLMDPNGRQGNYHVTLISGTLTVTNGPAPDLRVISVSMPPEAWTGRKFDVAWVLTNAGSITATGPWVDRIYLSATNHLRTNVDQLLGEFPFFGHLDPGHTVQRIQTVAVNPSGFTNGLYYIRAFADATNGVFEGYAETNNVGISISNIDIRVTPLPDLIVDSVDAPTAGLGGQPVEVSWIVCNQGGGDTDIPLWFDHVYLSPTTNIANAIADYGQLENPSYLAAGDCYEQLASVILPIGVGGPYYLIVKADFTGLLTEESKTNNTGSTIVPINIQLVQPGFLHVESVQVAPSPPTTVWAGGLVTVTWTVRNTGQSTISSGSYGGWDDEVTLSPTPTYDFVNGYWDVIHHIWFYGSLAPGQSYTHSEQFSVPQGITAGNWYAVPIVDTHFLAAGAGIGSGNIGRDQNSALVQVALPPPSDLEVTAVSAPTNAVAGQPINVRWTVANNGNNQTSGGYWYDAIYLSTNSTFDINQSRRIGTYGHWGVLDLTSNYSQSASVTVPADLFATNILVATHFLFVVADAGNGIVELDKTNNILGAANPLVIQQAPPILLADLAVTTVEAPWTTIAGSQVFISWAVANQGAGPTSAGSWVDSVYLSPSAKLNLASAQLLGNVSHNSMLTAGSSYSQSQTFNLPYCAIGSNYVIVLVDSGAQVNEGGALANNVRASDQPMHIWPGNAARLEVSAVNPPANVLAGTLVTVSWTVGNSGSATTTAPWVDALYLSTTPQFVRANAYLLGLYTNGANLASGGSYTRALSSNVPRCFSGPYYVAVVTDIGNVVNGVSCHTNNWRVSSEPVQVMPDGYASLQVADIALPAAVNFGYSWNVQWTVTNAGPSATFDTWSDAIYASLSPTLDANALILGRFDHTNILASGASYTQTQAVSFPSCWSGNYYVYVAADVGNRVNGTACVINNQARSPSTLTVNVGDHPDLAVSAVGIPVTAYAGESMSVSWTVTNSGTARANGPWLDSVYLSSSGTLGSGNSVFLGSYPYDGSLAAGAAYNQTKAFILPNSTHGDFTVYVVTDSTNTVNECEGENNNLTASSSTLNVPVTLYPDLKVAMVQAPDSAYAGQNVNISWSVTNQGTDSTPGSTVWNDAVFLSKDEVLDPSDKRLGTFARPSSLGVGQSYTNSATIQIPAGAAGPYYILVLADSAGSLFEYLGYNDSLGWNPSAMMVSLPPTADLAATNVTIDPAVAVPGDTVAIGWNVRNVSSNSIPSTWTDAVYLSTNMFWDINAVQVTRQNHNGLAASAAYSDSWTGPLPALTPGSYHALVRTDVRNTVRETNLVNNFAASVNTIAVDVPILVLGQSVTNQLTTGSARYYKLNVPAGETVRVILSGASTNSFNELFVRYGAVPDLGNYDFLYSNPLSPNQQIDIPTTQGGWYYIMVRGGNEPGGPLAYTLQANIVPFAISSVSQNHIGDNGQVTITLTGAKFQAGATVQLAFGTNIYVANTQFFVDATSVKARFVFTNAVHGVYDVVLTNPNSQSTTAAQAVTIETALPLAAQEVLGLVDNHPRVGLPFKWNGAVVNVGNVDIQYATVGIGLSQPFPIALNPPPGVVIAQTNSTDNSSGVCLFLAHDLAPSGSLAFSFVVSGFGSQDFLFNIIPTLQSKPNYLNQIATQAETARQVALVTPGISPDAARLLSDSNLWLSVFATNLVAAGLLDAADLANLPQPTSENFTQGRSSLVSPKSQAACDGCAGTRAAEIAALGVALIACLLICNFGTIAACLGCTITWLAGFAAIQIKYEICKLTNCGPDQEPCLLVHGVCPSRAKDPNEMLGPAGYSAAAFVGSQTPWQYTVYFENTSNALAFARQVVITNALDPSFDVRTFRVSEIAFGNVTITVPANRSFYQTRIAAPYPNPTNIVVDVTAGIDAQHGVVSLTLNAIDLNTGQLVESADYGVLPPNTTNHVGEGHISYSIKPKSSVPTGTVITNQVAIVFDINDPINTNPTTNTVDAVPPTSTVLALPSTVPATNFTVSWSGTDDIGGSGVGSYDVYVSDNGGPWQTWLSAVAQTSATCGGQPGHYYYFYSIARDNSGNVQPVPGGYEAMTFVATNQPPTLSPVADQTLIVGNNLVLTNLTGDSSGSQNLKFTLQNAPSGASVNPTNGNFIWTPDCAQGSTTNLITIWATDIDAPTLSNSVTFAVVVSECVQVSIGSTVMQVGTTSSVPVNLLSTVALTNLSFTLSYPTNRFTNWTLTASNTAIGGVSVQTLGPTDALFTLNTKSGEVLQGPALAGISSFSAMSNSSAFVPLTIANIQGTKSDGSPVGNTFGLGGRVVVIGNQPLLESSLGTNAQRMLRVYGNPGDGYQVYFSTNVATTNWLFAWRSPQTNLAQDYYANQQLSAVFYRALKLSADPPILDLNSVTSTNLTLLLYGISGTNYVIQATTNVSLTNGWFPATNFMLTNSFEFFDTGKPTNNAMFFRTKRP